MQGRRLLLDAHVEYSNRSIALVRTRGRLLCLTPREALQTYYRHTQCTLLHLNSRIFHLYTASTPDVFPTVLSLHPILFSYLSKLAPLNAAGALSCSS